MHWVDRTNIKKDFDRKIDESRYITINVHDDVEMEDVKKCINKKINKHFHVVVSNNNSSGINRKFEFLNYLVSDLEDKGVACTNFRDYLNDFKENSNLNMENRIADSIQARGNVNFNNVLQTNYYFQLKNDSENKEDKIDEFIAKFIDDLNGFNSNKPILILFLFQEDGCQKLDSKFKTWFKKSLINQMKKVRNLKIVLLDYGRSDSIIKSEDHIDVEETVNLYDLQIFIEECRGTLFSDCPPELYTKKMYERLSQAITDALMSSIENERDITNYVKAKLAFRYFCNRRLPANERSLDNKCLKSS